VTKRTLLIDGDVVVYQRASAAELAVDWGGGLWTLWSHEDQAIGALDEYIDRLKEKLEADHVVLALTDADTNWRKDIYPPYKSNRKNVRKPLLHSFLREYVLDNYDCYLRPRLEGDDVLGILATSKRLVTGEKVIVSVDKDMKTIPGLFYDAGDPDQGIIEITQEEADRNHLIQALSGDATDGYPGCPGVGSKKAAELLAEPYVEVEEWYVLKSGKNKGETRSKWVKEPTDSLWEAIVSQYEKAGLNEEFALQMARVARILRNTDYDFNKKEPKLWNPT